MGLVCDGCEILLRGLETRKAIGGKCPCCGRPMVETRLATREEREKIVRLVKEGKIKRVGEEELN